MSWYIKVIKNYAVFEGRARRKEFWMFIMFHSIFLFALAIIDNLIFPPHSFPFILSGLYWLFAFIPNLAVSVRRLHDIGWSGWGLLIGLIPYLGALILIIVFAINSEAGDNKYGPNPKGNDQKAKGNKSIACT